MKLLKQLITTTTTTLISVLSMQASASALIELTYTDSQIQCGADSDPLVIVVDVYHNEVLIAEDLAVGESILLPNLEGISMSYESISDECDLATPTELHLTQEDPLPNLPGAYEQDSIAVLMSELNEYEDLYLVELGTTDTDSFAYDLQDAIFIVNNNPTVFAD